MGSMDDTKTSQKKSRKRPSDVPEVKTNDESKKKKTSFSVIEFKFYLSDPSTIFLGFEKFIEAAQPGKDNDGEDIVAGFCKSSPECEEIMQVFQTTGRKPNELQLVFLALEKILLRIADDLGKYYNTGQTIVRKLLTAHANILHNVLNNKNKSGPIKSGLKLLVSMVMLGPQSAKLVLDHVDFGHATMVSLWKRRDTKDEEDVRTCFSLLVIAYLLAGDGDVIRRLIQIKGLMENMFQGIQFDRISSIQLLLSSVLEKVVMNPAISKTAKVQVFTEKTLKELCHLYSWQGPAKWKQSLGAKQSDSQEPQTETVMRDEDGMVAMETVTQFLTELCSSYKNGIIFHDKTYGLSGRNQNHLMTAVLSSLLPHCNQSVVCSLVTDILTACPDQLHRFMQSLAPTLSPREASKWVTSLNFLVKVYRSLQDSVRVLKIKDVKTAEQLVNILLVYTFPPQHVLTTVFPGIRNKSLAINYQVMVLVREMLETATIVLKALQQTTLYSPEVTSQAQILYTAQVLKTLPDVMSVFGCWDKMTSATSTESKATELQKLYELSSVDVAGFRQEVVQTLCLYQEVSPNMLVEHPVILGKLLEGVMSEPARTKSVDGENSAEHLTQVHLLKLLSATDARRLPWAKKNVAGHTLLYQLLEISTSLIDTSDLSESVLELVCKLLETTGQFDGHHDELLLWLRTIRQFGQGVQESVSKCGQGVLEFVSRVMMTYIHNPYPYMDTVCDIQSSVAMETESANGQSVDIEDIEKMDGIPLESDDFEDSPEPTKRFNFCPMLLVAMETAQKEENLDNDVYRLLSTIVLHTFHMQAEPRALCEMLEVHGKKVVPVTLMGYVELWMKKSKDVSAKTLQTLWQVPDKLMSDGLVVPLHTTAKTEVSQALLKLSLLVGCINKKNEKVVLDEMEKVMDALLAETKKTTEQLDSVNCVTTTSSGLENVSKETTGKQHIRCVKMVLDHHVIKEYFLADLNETKSPKAKISKCVSSFVATLFSMTDMFGKDMQEIFGFYSEKCEQILSSGEDVKNLELIVKIAHILGKALPTEKCVQFLNLVICFSLRGKSKMSSGDSSSSMMCLVDTLLGRIRGSSLKIVKLTEESFNNLLNLFLEDDQSKLLALCSFVARFPSLAVLCMEDKVESLVSSEDGINLLKMLMRNNMALTMKVCDLVNQGHLDVRENLGLLDLCLQQLKGKAYLKDAYDKTCSNVMKALKSDWLKLCSTQPMEQSDLLLNTLQTVFRSGQISSKMLTSLKKKIQALFEGESEILPRYVDLVKLLLGDSELKGSPTPELIAVCVRGLSAEFSRHRKLTDVVHKLLDILSAAEMEELGSVILDIADVDHVWSSFLKSLLKYLFTDVKALTLLAGLIPVIYRSDKSFSITVATVVDMVTSHSGFLQTMFGDHGQKCKGCLVDLLTTLIDLNPSSCQTDHVGVLLGAYGASLSLTDQNILKLMQFYEKNEIPFSNFKPFIWGEKGIELYSLRRSLGPSLKQPGLAEVLSLVDKNKLHSSTLCFPLRRKLQGSLVCDAADLKSREDCYDPGFLLPLFSHLLEPANIIDCRKFVESECLGYVIAALSSHDTDMRSAALHVLDKFQGHLTVAKTPEKEQLMYVIEIVQNSLPAGNTKLASIITQFLARAVTLMLKPDEHMYMIMNSFLLLKPRLDTQNIPEFFKLFNSSALQHREERQWILSLMVDGLRETADYRIFEKRFAFKMLLGVFDSCLSDYSMQLQIVNLLTRACAERSVAKDLCNNHGFLVWLANTANNLITEKVQLVSAVTGLVHSLWDSLERPSEKSENPVSLAVCSQMAAILHTLLQSLTNVSRNIHQQYLETLLCVCMQLAKLSHDARGHVTQLASHGDILMILFQCQQKWIKSNLSGSLARRALEIVGNSTKKKQTGKHVSWKGKGKVHLNPDVVLISSQKKSEMKDTVDVDEKNDRTYMEVDGDVDDTASGSDSTLNDEEKIVVETLMKIVLLWKKTSDIATGKASLLVDVIVLRWMLNVANSVKELDGGIIDEVVSVIDEKMLSDTGKGLLAKFVGTYSLESEEVIEALICLHDAVAKSTERTASGKKEDGNADHSSKLTSALNRVLAFVVEMRYGSKIPVNFNAEIRSVAIRKAFLCSN
ncbi:nucleolar pre-ribosomal-associated protein 1-like [Mya arenaria]|uniref:nucleolar pre-ribosomal-associated protein 1-like n=1 Tax=Mya arenaria TaxID=6604 RepID=UPI0022E823CA|nr:nucleolar pre-ribosomal-associated protein 1-like [Mya arenaria]